MPIAGKDDNLSDNLGSHKEEELALKRPNKEENYIDLASKSLDTGSRAIDMLSGLTPQVGLSRSELSSSLREIKFGNQEFAAGAFISNIKYNYPGFQNDNLFSPFYD